MRPSSRTNANISLPDSLPDSDLSKEVFVNLVSKAVKMEPLASLRAYDPKGKKIKEALALRLGLCESRIEVHYEGNTGITITYLFSTFNVTHRIGATTVSELLDKKVFSEVASMSPQVVDLEMHAPIENEGKYEL